LDTIIGFILDSQEVSGWWTDIPLTMATIVINLLCVNQVVGTWKQSHRIWKERSVEGVSITTMTFYGFYFMAFLLYGINQGKLNMVIGGFQFLFYVPILLGAWKFSTAAAKRLLAIRSLQFAFLPIIMFFIPWKNAYLLFLLAGILWTMVLMYRELKWAAGVGSVEVTFLWSFFISAIFWFCYGWMLRDVALMIFNPLAGLILGATIKLYYKKRAAVVVK
jgi:uncharacterized protein with PQ loop repeat